MNTLPQSAVGLPADAQAAAQPASEELRGEAAPASSGTGIRLTVRGSYLDLSLSEGDRVAAGRIYWDKLISAVDYPTAMAVTLYTVSLDRTWMQV